MRRRRQPNGRVIGHAALGICGAIGTVAAAQVPMESPESEGFSLNGILRARYDYHFDDIDASGRSESSSHVGFDTLAISPRYTSDSWFGTMQYRFYGGAFPYEGAPYKMIPGEVNFPVDAFAGYHLSADSAVVAGLNVVPFGPGRFFTTAFYETLAFDMGFEDTHDFGVKYSYKDESWRADLGFYPADGGSWVGTSRDAARYSANLVKADPGLPGGSDNEERDMLIGRVLYKLSVAAASSLEFGLSGWRSAVHNSDTGKDGSLSREAIDVAAIAGPWHLLLLAARQDIDARNRLDRNLVTVGGYDSSYNMAARGTFATFDLTYADIGGFGPIAATTPYVNYSALLKDESAYRDSQRWIIGLRNYYGPSNAWRSHVELLIGKNDPNVGAGESNDGLAAGGANRWKMKIYSNFGYYF